VVKGHTHVFAGAAAALPLALGAHGIWEPAILGAGAFGALIPDIDHSGSTVGRWIPWRAQTRQRGKYVEHGRAWFLGRTIWHRGPTHSIIGGVVVAALAALVLHLVNAPIPPGLLVPLCLALTAGYWSHLIIDAVNVGGMPVLWPFSHRTFRAPLPALPQNSWLGQLAEIVVIVGCVAAVAHWAVLPAHTL
jgi:inner membrane protein